MVNLLKEIEVEKDNVKEALANLNETLARIEKSIVELAAIATFLHNIYNGTENILKRILKASGSDIPKSVTWHKDLLELSVAKGIISAKLSDELYEYLAFRHYFIYSYGFKLEESRLNPLATKIFDV
jgi:uncharacterized protein YutE (UPF0331/DUF86 family)